MFKRTSPGDVVFSIIVYIILAVLTLIVLIPLLHVLAASFSAPAAVTAGRVGILPVDFSLRGYETVFNYSSVITGYRNSLIYMTLGTSLNLTLTLITAYPLAKRDLPYRSAIMGFFAFCMFFNGGMIPNYILMRDLRLLNTIWAMVVPGAIGVTNMIIMRTFIQENIPNELYEAADIDGCDEFKYLFRIVIPLSKASIAVITLFYAVGHWNAFFNAFLYLHNPNLRPLQIVLREILIQNTINQNELLLEGENFAQMGMAELLKYSLIIVASVPMLVLYPFIQKHFVKGVMIGSLKG